MALPEVFWQALLGLYVLATLVQLVVWCFLFGKLGRWTLDVGRWTLDVGHGTLDVGHGTLDVGHGTLDVGHGTLDVGQSQLPITHHRLPITNPPITIIICARNEAENLRRCLPAVLAQQFDAPWELLVVDDASEDETSAVLQFFQEKNHGRMRVLRIADKTALGKKHALSQGIAGAKYDYLLLTDADCVPANPNWLAHMAAALTERPKTEIVLGYGPMRPPLGNGSNLTTLKKLSNFFSVSLWSRYETAFVAAQYFSFALVGMPYMGVGRNLAFKRHIFEKVGGFSNHEHIPSGDDDLLVNAAANAENTRICLNPESFVYSDAPTNWSAWYLQKRRHMAASSVYRWPHKIALAMVALSQIGFYFLFALLVLAGFHPMLIIGMFLLRLFVVLFVFVKILHVLREPGLWWRIPLLDLLMAIYYGLLMPWLLVGKKQRGWS